MNNFVGPAPQVQAANISREDLQEEIRQTRLKISICEEKLRCASLSQVQSQSIDDVKSPQSETIPKTRHLQSAPFHNVKGPQSETIPKTRHLQSTPFHDINYDNYADGVAPRDFPDRPDPSISSLSHTSNVPVNVDHHIRDDYVKLLTDVLSHGKTQDKLPRIEPDILDGSLLRFPLWMKSFETILEKHTDSVSERLFYLSKYTTGPAKAAIIGYFGLDSDDSYANAKKTLLSRFGNTFIVYEAFRNKLNNWPVIKPGDGDGLSNFGDFLSHCRTAMASISYLSCLDSIEENKKLITVI